MTRTSYDLCSQLMTLTAIICAAELDRPRQNNVKQKNNWCEAEFYSMFIDVSSPAIYFPKMSYVHYSQRRLLSCTKMQQKILHTNAASCFAADNICQNTLLRNSAGPFFTWICVLKKDIQNKHFYAALLSDCCITCTTEVRNSCSKKYKFFHSRS